MKLILTDDDRRVFRLGQQEQDLLRRILDQYPLLPDGYHQFTRSGVTADDPENQALLDEALATHHDDLRRRVRELFNDPTRLAPDQTSYRLSLTREDLEWLLQVLNEVRVGSWVRAGCPDPEDGPPAPIATDKAPFFILMEVAAYFESALLDAC